MSSLPPEGTPAWTGHATRLAVHMRRYPAQAGQRLLIWPTDPPDTLQAAEETFCIMTKQVFQLTDAVPTSKPDIPATREHPVFTPAQAPVQQPEGAAPPRGRASIRRSQGAKNRKAPAKTKPAPKPEPKIWTRGEAAALYNEYTIGTRVQLPFEYATAARPSTSIWAAGEVTHRYRVTGDRQGFKIEVQWAPNECGANHRALARPERSGHGPHKTLHPRHRAPHRHGVRGRSPQRMALPQPEKWSSKAPTAQGVKDLLDP